MNISAVNNISLKNNYNIDFQGRKNKGEKNAPKTSSSPITNPMVTVPLSLLLTLASVNAPIQAGNRVSDVENNKIELVDQYDKPINYPKSEGYKEYMKNYKSSIIKTYDFRNGKDTPYTLVLMESEWFPGDKSRCGEIFIVPYNFEYKKIGSGLWDDPPKVAKLIYHNLGEDKEFCGVLVRMEYWGKQIKPFKYEDLGYKEFEVRLPDEIANVIIDMMAKKSNMDNMTGIEFKETKSPNLIPLRDVQL